MRKRSPERPGATGPGAPGSARWVGRGIDQTNIADPARSVSCPSPLKGDHPADPPPCCWSMGFSRKGTILDIMHRMSATADHRILDEMLDPVGQCLTPEVAARIAALRADRQMQHRLDELAEKNSAGTLTPREVTEYEAYVEALDVIAILQAKARNALKAAGRSK